MIKTWQQRCEEHPDHEGIVTEQMIRDRMQEEIDELRQALAQPEQECTCSAKDMPFGRCCKAQPEQEPAAWVLYYNNEHGMPMRETFYAKAHMEFHKSYNETKRGLKCQVVPLYTAPQKREWVGLTENEKQFFKAMGFSYIDIVEERLKDKNT